MIDDYGDLTDLRARLEFLRSGDDRRLVTIFGAGISNQVIPDVKGMTEMFREVIPESGRARFDANIDPILGDTLGYQNAAALLKRQAGETALAGTIRRAVLGCRGDLTPERVRELSKDVRKCQELETSSGWPVPEAYRRFARFFSSLSGAVRGPVVTGNFDPLIEIALREEGVPAVAVPVPLDSVPTSEQVRQHSAVPVFHLNGYWTSNATLGIAGQLTRPRPHLSRLLQDLFTGSAVLVLAHAGWRDAFMASLVERAGESELLDAEILWGAHDRVPRTETGDALTDLREIPAVTVYTGIDVRELFEDAPAPGAEPVDVSPYGYTRLPVACDTTAHLPERFVEGGHPTWHDAVPGRWPMLAATRELKAGLETWLQKGGGGGVVAIGPVGEGKSLAIRQVATAIGADFPDWTVLWREPGAPKITSDWIREVVERYGPTLLCVDDADLVVDELISASDAWRTEGSGIALLLASHDRLWWHRGNMVKAVVDDVLFHGLSADTATEIARAWSGYGLLREPGGNDPAAVVKDYADRLSASSRNMVDGRQSTLFGAILDVRYGNGLKDRVRDLVDKLSGVKVHKNSPVTLGEIFGGICVMQDTLDRYGTNRKGANRSVIAGMVGLNTVFADGKILRLLGREAAIAYAGDRIYSRHPAIARTTVEYLRAEKRMVPICRLIGRSGAVLRDQAGPSSGEYRDAYLLCHHLADGEEAKAAALGAVKGANDLLEPRVTLLSTLRKFDIERAEKYASALGSHGFETYRDYGNAIRAYLVEYSHVAQRKGEPYLGMGLAALAISDGLGLTLDAKRASFALTSLVHAGLRVRAQNAEAAGIVPEYSYVLMERAFRAEAEEHLAKPATRMTHLKDARALSSEAIVRRLKEALTPIAAKAKEQINLPVDEDGPPYMLQDLRQLIE